MSEQEHQHQSAVLGRRRSENSHRAILQATMEVLEETGYRAMTIEAIAERAGVGKKTIYRWWPSKAAVALEALTSHTEVQERFSDTGSLEGDLLSYVELLYLGLQGKTG